MHIWRIIQIWQIRISDSSVADDSFPVGGHALSTWHDHLEDRIFKNKLKMYFTHRHNFCVKDIKTCGPEQLSLYSDSIRAGPGIEALGGGGEIFRTRRDRPWGPPSFLYNGNSVSFPGTKRPRRSADHPPQTSVKVKEKVELTSTFLWAFMACCRDEIYPYCT